MLAGLHITKNKNIYKALISLIDISQFKRIKFISNNPLKNRISKERLY